MSEPKSKSTFTASRPLILPVNDHGIVRSGNDVPTKPLSAPALVLHGRIAEVRKQIEAFRKQTHAHPILMTVAAT